MVDKPISLCSLKRERFEINEKVNEYYLSSLSKNSSKSKTEVS